MRARNPVTGSHPQGSSATQLSLRVRQGRELWFGDPPDSTKIEPCHAGSVGLMGADYPERYFDPVVTVGDAVALGQRLCTDRHEPAVGLVAPCAGRVTQVVRGARRRLETLVIAPEGDGALTFAVPSAPGDSAALRALLLESGAWVGFRARPFGRVPNLDSMPDAIFVTATDTRPLAIDPHAVLAPMSEQFQRGCTVLRDLTEGTVVLCQQEGPALMPSMDRLTIAHISGPHPAGLAGTQCHHLFPVSETRVVWEIGYQDVVALGHLLITGTIMGSRVLSLAGTGVKHPQAIQAPLGAAISDLTQGRLSAPEVKAGTGSPLDMRALPYVGRRDLQVSAMVPAALSHSVWGNWLDRLSGAKDGVMLPLEAFERAFPFDLLPAPLMRALAIGDTESAYRLGCLELLEEDMALLSAICPSGCDYGALLRRTLDVLAGKKRA